MGEMTPRLLRPNIAITPWYDVSMRPWIMQVRPAKFALVLAAALSAMAYNAEAQEGDIEAGHDLAEEACKSCHMIEPERRLPNRIEIAPPFRDIADSRAMTATSLKIFLTSSHPKMPNLFLTPGEIADLAAYILSLRNRH